MRGPMSGRWKGVNRRGGCERLAGGAVFRRLEYISNNILIALYILGGLSRHPSMVVHADDMLAFGRRLRRR